MLVNVDGLTLLKSSTTFVLANSWESKRKTLTIPIGVWCEPSKPKCAHELLRPFVDEAKKLKEDSFVQGVQHYTVKIWGCSCDSSAGSFITGNRGITVRNACPKYAKQMECITRSPARLVKEKHSRISTLLYGLTKILSTGHVRISTQWGQLCWRNWTSTWC